MNNKLILQDSAGDELRARILTAARERFQQFGYAKTSMLEIATACDMSPANLYRFYDGKLAIGAAVAWADQAEQLAAVDLAVQTAGPEVANRLIALFQANIDATRRKMKRRPLLFELWLTVAREKPDLRRQFLHDIEARIMAILAVGHDMSAFESAAIKLRSRLIMLASAPFVLPWMMQNEPFGNPRAMVEPLIRSSRPAWPRRRPRPTLPSRPDSARNPAIFRSKPSSDFPLLSSFPFHSHPCPTKLRPPRSIPSRLSPSPAAAG